jgi:hypothetical protein
MSTPQHYYMIGPKPLSATAHGLLPLLGEFVLWAKIKEEDRHEADGPNDVIDISSDRNCANFDPATCMRSTPFRWRRGTRAATLHTCMKTLS